MVPDTVENWERVKNMVLDLQMCRFCQGEKTNRQGYDPRCTVWDKESEMPVHNGPAVAS